MADSYRRPVKALEPRRYAVRSYVVVEKGALDVILKLNRERRRYVEETLDRMCLDDLPDDEFRPARNIDSPLT